ncbi:MAG: HlyD family secretion protein [Gammaproteobacteria bacterium]
MVLVAAFGARWLWIHYNVEPWTRDGRIRADVAQISPDVNALVTEVHVEDNQIVHAGDVLLALDKSRYELAVKQAEAAIAADEAALAQAIRENRRNEALETLVTGEQTEQGAARVAELRAQLRAAVVQRDVARLNLARTTVIAPVNGVATNVNVQPGDYAAVGRPLLALLNSNSIRVEGYFEETKLPRIRLGDLAIVHVMGLDADLHGTVESIAAGIEDRERGASSTGLANINPTFSWVRLAQRVPVRIRLESVPEDVRLIAGRTVTVSIHAPHNRRIEGDE